MEKLLNFQQLDKLRQKLKKELFVPNKPIAKVCCGPACSTLGSHNIANAINNESRSKNLNIEVIKTGCHGMCQRGPNIETEPNGFYYQGVRPDNVPELIDYTFRKGVPFRKFLHREHINKEPISKMYNIPFYQKQFRIALRNCDKIDPTNIYHYLTVGGYNALELALSSMAPEDVLKEVDMANLRGRGGAGFPAGRKWQHSKDAQGDIKFVIANGDEGDPGAFMDRAVMEGDPHSLFEGMLLCAFAIGAQYGFIYVRHEYPIAVKHLKIALEQAEKLGFLGDNILGTNFNFYLDIREGAGAFVCGESTALIASIEGDRGFPRPRPPRLSERGGGLWGYPTNLNNIETYACVPPIIEKGAKWFSSIGTITSPGTKVFALSGKVQTTGLVEVPMGVTLRQIVFDIAGGIPNGKKFKAVQTGGPSGGCIPEKFLDMPVDFDSLKNVGSIMGSGGMVVMDEDTCMVDVARYFLAFTQSESCGKCTPCRVGTYQMLKILERITQGNGQHGDIERLINIGNLIQRSSLCGLGQSAPTPVLSTIKYFRQEYEEHIYNKYCKANICKQTGIFIINHTECIACGLCKNICAFNAIKETKDSYIIKQNSCDKCKSCFNICPVGAVEIIKQDYIRREDMPKIFKQIKTTEQEIKMTLKNLIGEKTKGLVSCGLDCKVSDAIVKMKTNDISSILVLDEYNKLAGIFTERDVIDCVINNVSLKNESVKNVMTKDIVTLNSSTDIGIAMSIMSEKRIRHLPVIEDNNVIGIISFRDLVSYFLPDVRFMIEDIYMGKA